MNFESLEKRMLCSVVQMGDANGDGRIDGSDYSLIDNGFGSNASGWSNGDFNGDGVIDGSDYSLMDNAFNTQGATKTYAVRPGDSIQAVANIVNPGDSIVILPGTYHEAVKFTRGGTVGAPITVSGFGSNQTTIDGVGLSSVWTSGSYFAINGITFNGSTNALQTGGVTISSHSTVSDVIVQNCESVGLNIQGTDVTATNLIVQNNGEMGLKGTNCDGITLTNCITRNNNTGLANPNWAGKPQTVLINGLWYVSPQFEAGGGKFAFSKNIVVDGLQSYGNVGHGFDFDISNYAVTVKNSTFHDARWIDANYEAMGLSIEISYGPAVVTNNTFFNDSGNGLSIQTSSNVTITGNSFTKANIGLTNWARGSDWKLSNISISSNTINNCQITTNGNMSPWNTSSITTMNLAIFSNTWIKPPAIAVQWGSTSYSLSGAGSVLGIS